MAGEWETKRIGDLGRVVTGKTPSTSVAENFGGNYPFITIPDMDGRREISHSARTLSEQGAQSLRTCRLPAGAVMMSCIATIGNCGITTQPSFTNQQINSLICGDDADPKFVYYCFTQLGHALEAAGGGGSVYTNVSKSRFEEIELTLPPLAEQKAIAAVLGALDDKIELNRRMNATLEAMARALFQSWFVDFDPVRLRLSYDGQVRATKDNPTGLPAEALAKAGLDPATAALFPDSFQDSELGEIPKGWRVGTLGELVELRTDRVDATPAKDNARYIALEDMPSKSIDLSSFQLGSAVNSSITAFRKGDVLFGSMRPYFHKVGLAFFDGITRTTTFVLRPRKDCFRHFALLHFFSEDVVAHSTTASVGTTIPYVRWDSMESYRIPIPPDSLLEAFEKTVSPLVQRIAAQGEESRTLATLRDTLLPKLLSGEITHDLTP